MKKRVMGKKLSRERASREALFVSLLDSLVVNRKIVTTVTKARAISFMADSLVTLAKKGTLASKRRILSVLRGNKDTAKLLWTDISLLFQNKNGGYTRIVPLGERKGDSAKTVRLEWTYENISTKEKRN